MVVQGFLVGDFNRRSSSAESCGEIEKNSGCNEQGGSCGVDYGSGGSICAVLFVSFQSFVEQIPIRVADIEHALNPPK